MTFVMVKLIENNSGKELGSRVGKLTSELYTHELRCHFLVTFFLNVCSR